MMFQNSSRSNSPDIRGDRSGGECSSEQDKDKHKPMLSRKEVSIKYPRLNWDILVKSE